MEKTKIKGKSPRRRQGNIPVRVDEEGVEHEEKSYPTKITKPFDPTGIRVSSRIFTIDLLLDRISHSELNLAPGFQRREGIWNNRAKSQLIESILLRIPLPAFYMDATNDHVWEVVDGLQRLSILKSFVITKNLKLCELEFLTHLNGLGYDDLDRSFQRRIRETQVTAYLIEEGTPKQVTFNIFKRINTGGLPLSAQEIRHALNQGPGTDFLDLLAKSEEFKRTTDNGISEKRMGDRECVLRFLAFVINPPEKYLARDFDEFLNESMAQLNKMSYTERKELRRQFKRSMEFALKIFGRYAFRKRYYSQISYRYPINKALFESWSVNLNRLEDAQLECLVKNKRVLEKYFCKLMQKERVFESAVSQGTGDIRKVRRRFRDIEKIIRKAVK